MPSPHLPNAYVLPLENLRMADVNLVGGKNASLGELMSQLSATGVRVPGGFATTAAAYRDFLGHNQLTERIRDHLARLNVDDVSALAQAGAAIRGWIIAGPFQARLQADILRAFTELDGDGKGSFAVRSSATAEDLPNDSFAGQQETFLNVAGSAAILQRIHEVYASLYNDRAISYRVHKDFDHSDIAVSVGIQRMVRSDCGAAGVMFTLDTESGFRDVVLVTSSYGLGESVVQGAVNPDEFYVFKSTLAAGHHAIIRRSLGSKLTQIQFAPAGAATPVVTTAVQIEQQNCFSINDTDVAQLAGYAVSIEQHYGRPMDIEWAKDGIDGALYILQARPETVKSQAQQTNQLRYKLKGQSTILASGRAIGQKIGSGPVRVIKNVAEMARVQPGDVLVADMTDPNWEPVMKRAAAIVTNRGGRTCHAAIIARELGVPAVVGCGEATSVLADGMIVTVSCAEGDEGRVYAGRIETEVTELRRSTLPKIPVKIMMNVGNPQLAFDFCQIPNSGVGLARLEFIINNNIGVHPNAILEYPNIDLDLKRAVESVARGHASPRAFYVDKLAEGIATIAAAFYPKPVIVRLSDFKSNEYKKLIGGSRYEPDEENPMLGFRGASRYLAAEFAPAFAMECEALQRVRNRMGLTNVEIMIPFVRTVVQAGRVINLLESHGLRRGENGLRMIMMCEIPSNAILAEQFLEHFDGFSIGSNDLTQLTLGLDRDSGMGQLAVDFDEQDPAVLSLMATAIEICHVHGKYIGICGQGPSDSAQFAKWLMDRQISSISLNPDSVVKTWELLASTATDREYS